MSALDQLGEFPRQDYIILGPMKSPGKARIIPTGASPRKWDERQGYGFSGATIVYTGTGLARFSVAIELWTPTHFLDWEVFAKACLDKPLPGLKPKALGIYHPILALAPWRISSVVVEDVALPDEDDEELYTIVVDFKEFRAPLPALGKPLAAIPAASTPVPTAQDAADKEMQAKLATLRALAGGGV